LIAADGMSIVRKGFERRTSMPEQNRRIFIDQKLTRLTGRFVACMVRAAATGCLLVGASAQDRVPEPARPAPSLLSTPLPDAPG
jgi:hypothetical protein